ncbi:MAG TPA: hypothetical protein VHE83_06760 [Mycobacteriales bacterium]|nr:hypothetical protein [Mycobacteriales bacterium]
MAGNDRVALTDLGVISRYSLALRTAEADRADVIALLRADLAWLEGESAVEEPRKAPRRR